MLSLVWLLLLKFCIQVHIAADYIEIFGPIGKALLLDCNLMAAGSDTDLRGRVAGECVIDFDVRAWWRGVDGQ